MSQLASLTKVSSNCEQFIQYECHHSMMTNVGWWVSRDSTKMNWVLFNLSPSLDL